MNKTYCDRCEKQIGAGTQLPTRKIWLHSDVDPYGKGNAISGTQPYAEICIECFNVFYKMYLSWKTNE